MFTQALLKPVFSMNLPFAAHGTVLLAHLIDKRIVMICRAPLKCDEKDASIWRRKKNRVV